MAQAKYIEWLKDDNLLRIEAWARDGLTQEDIAHNIGITFETLSRWKKSYTQINQALKRGKEVVDIIVENALFKRAIGYDYEETVTEVKIINGKEHKQIKKHKKHMAGDTTAQIFWLKNRKIYEWRDRKNEEIDKDTKLEIEVVET